jgi:CTP synthase
LTKLKLAHVKNDPDLESWKDFLGRLEKSYRRVRIGLVGKYVELPDAYKSISEAFIHAGAKNGVQSKGEYIPFRSTYTRGNAVEKLERPAWRAGCAWFWRVAVLKVK